MRQHWQDAQSGAQCYWHMADECIFTVEEWQAMQAGPHTGRRSFVQPHGSVYGLRPQQPNGLGAALERAGAHRVALRVTRRCGCAILPHRAGRAVGLLGQAHCSAQVHHALRITRHGSGGIFARRQQLRGCVPQGPHIRTLRQVGIKTQHAGHHPFDIGIQYGDAFAKTQRRNCRGGGSAYSGQGL